MLESRMASRLSAEHGYQIPARAGVTTTAQSTETVPDEADAVTAAPLTPAEAPEHTAATIAAPAIGDDDGPPAFDESAESAFLAEARERGETVARPAATVNGDADESGGRPLPKLDELVQRIPPEIRDVLDELFRARFVTVKRFPKKVLKA